MGLSVNNWPSFSKTNNGIGILLFSDVYKLLPYRDMAQILEIDPVPYLIRFWVVAVVSDKPSESTCLTVPQFFCTCLNESVLKLKFQDSRIKVMVVNNGHFIGLKSQLIETKLRKKLHQPHMDVES